MRFINYSMKSIFSMLFFVLLLGCHSPNQEVASQNPLIHSVYFWFQEDVTPERIVAFEHAAKGLIEINGVQAVYIGAPADTHRPVVERSYDMAVIVHLDDLVAHDNYQNDPIHLDLVKEYSKDWNRVMITDID